MNNLKKYIENAEFVQWVYNPNKQSDDFWVDYIRNNPEEQENIQLAKNILSSFRNKDDGDYSKEASEIYLRITKDIRKIERKLPRRNLIIKVLKYAAVIFIVLSLVKISTSFESFISFISRPKPIVTADASIEGNIVMKLSDGKRMTYSKNNCQFEYLKNGNIIVNQKDTLIIHTSKSPASYNQIIVPFGNKASVTLSDGSTIQLNAGSSLAFPTFFIDKYREVYLSGEGYFNIVHLESQPFIVEISDISIEVLGTKFNVSAYPDDEFIETTLVDGEVKIHRPSEKDDYFLKPNELAYYDKETYEIKIAQVDVNYQCSWLTDNLNFQSVELNRILVKLERFYDINITIKSDKSGLIGKKLISGRLKLNNDKENVLEVLAIVASVKLKKIDEQNFVLEQ